MSDQKINDGGPAFPCTSDVLALNGIPECLTKREWFAGMAIQGAMTATIVLALGGKAPKENAESDLADTCYKIADAMIKERSK